MKTVALPLTDGCRVVVPDSLQHMTPYVLCEQQDWFEDEIKFLRRVLRPGDKVVDIGANYGAYTLPMARAVGAAGHVWCFEPASATAGLLAQSIAENHFAHVTLCPSAVSSTSGTARLALHDFSELNELVSDPHAAGPGETVPLTTLDECLEKFGWRDIAFLKIDAEGQEANILQGGRRTLAQLSPLIQYEVKAGDELHLGLVESFASHGYRSYRLVPGLALLVPFAPDPAPDGYQLNLFCCKPDRAAELADRGFLLDAPATLPVAAPDHFHWRKALATTPSGNRLARFWDQAASRAPANPENEAALALFCLSQDSTRPAAERLASLEAAFRILQSLCRDAAPSLRLASLARTARAWGARQIAVDALARLSTSIEQQRQVDLSEPFLVPSARFAAIDPGGRLGDWVLAATLEEQETLAAFSSFFTGTAALPRLERIRELGFAGAEMQRRLALVKRRHQLA